MGSDARAHGAGAASDLTALFGLPVNIAADQGRRRYFGNASMSPTERRRDETTSLELDAPALDELCDSIWMRNRWFSRTGSCKLRPIRETKPPRRQ